MHAGLGQSQRMKVVITGGTGQLGGALLKTAPADWHCLSPDRRELDLTGHHSIAEYIDRTRPDWVINSAAYTAVDAAEGDQQMAMQVNAEAPAAIAAALDQYGGRLCQVSTDFVFDGETTRPYRPQDACNPLSVYGRSKLEGEIAAGSDALIVRTSWVYAAGGKNFVRTMLRLMANGTPLRVVADQFGSPSWAPDIARAIWALVSRDASGTFHHSDAGIASWHEFAVAIGEEARDLGLLESVSEITPIPTEEYPTPAHRPRYSALDCSRTRDFLGLAAKPWRENLRTMLAEEAALARSADPAN